MVKKNAEQVGDILRALVDNPNFQQTVGAWITEGFEMAVQTMATATTEKDFWVAQGKFRAFDSLLTQLHIVFDAADREKRRRLTKLKALAGDYHDGTDSNLPF